MRAKRFPILLLIAFASSAPWRLSAQDAGAFFTSGMVTEVTVDPEWFCGDVPLTIHAATPECAPAKLLLQYRLAGETGWSEATVLDSEGQTVTQPVSIIDSCMVTNLYWDSDTDAGTNVEESAKLRALLLRENDVSEGPKSLELSITTSAGSLPDLDVVATDGVQTVVLLAESTSVLSRQNVVFSVATSATNPPLVLNLDLEPVDHSQHLAPLTFQHQVAGYSSQLVPTQNVESMPALFSVTAEDCGQQDTRQEGAIEFRQLHPVVFSDVASIVHSQL